MKKLVLLSTMFALCAAPAFANMDSADHKAMEEAMFTKMDTNGDGYISKEEHDAYAAKMFAEADTNGDGKISKDEMHAYKMKQMKEAKSTKADTAKTSSDAKTNSDATTK